MKIEKSPWPRVWDSQIITMPPMIIPFALLDRCDHNKANNHKSFLLEVHKRNFNGPFFPPSNISLCQLACCQTETLIVTSKCDNAH